MNGHDDNDDDGDGVVEPSSSSSSAPNYADDFSAQQQRPRQPRSSGPSTVDGSSLTASQISLRRKRNRQNFNQRRTHLLEELIRGLDVLVYAELGVGYYMDCSTPLLLLRSLLQFLYLTPKDPIFPSPPSGSKFLAMIFAANLFCGVLHFWRGGPAGTVVDRGYLHGGLVLDFIGQEGGVGRWRLVGLDVLVLGLQVVCCAVVRARARVVGEGLVEGVKVEGVGEGRGRARQGVEDEERGVRRSEEVRREGDVEMERLNPNGRRDEDGMTPANPAAGEEEEEEEGSSILASTTAALERTDARIFDAFNSGQIVLADLDLGKLLRDEWNQVGVGNSEEEDVVTRRNRATRRRLIERVRGRVGLGRTTVATQDTGIGEV